MYKTLFVATTSFAFGGFVGAFGLMALLIVIADEDEAYFDTLVNAIKH